MTYYDVVAFAVAYAALIVAVVALVRQREGNDVAALRVGPEDRLLVRVPPDSTPDQMRDLAEHLNAVGLGDRSLVVGAPVELTLVEPE